jgi:hypothetical protein
MGGRIAIAFQPRGPGATDEAATTTGQDLVAALRDAGFSQVRLETLELKPAVVCALGVNPSGETGGRGASPANSDFNFDLGASSTEEQMREQMPSLEGLAPDPASERGRVWDRRPELHLRIGSGEHLCARGQCRLPDLYDHVAWARVNHGLLLNPRPCAKGTRRRRRHWQTWIRRQDEYGQS